MKYLAVLFISIALLPGCANGKTNTDTAAPADLETYEGLSAALADSADIALYDVRTEEEYAQGHIPGAVNIPYDVIGEQIDIADKEAVIVVYCRSGSRSGQAKKTLESLGYKNVVNFGGVSNWRGDLVTGMPPG